MHYLKEPAFWVAVVLVAIIVNFLWKTLLKGKGKLV